MSKHFTARGTPVPIPPKDQTRPRRSAKQALRDAWGKVAPILLYLLRASFGAALIASVALVFTTILVASSSRDRDDRDDRRGGGGLGDFFVPIRIFGPSPFDLLFYDPFRPLGPNRYAADDGRPAQPGTLLALNGLSESLNGSARARRRQRRHRRP